MSELGESLLVPRKVSPLRVVAVLAAVGAAIAAGSWWQTRQKGQAEDPARVLIVGPNPALVDFLARAGFDPEHASVGQAIGQGQVYDRNLDDLAAMLEYADQRGFGYLALDLAQGQSYDFASVGYAADAPPPGTSFAILSVGTLGKAVSYGGVVPEVAHAPETAEQIGLLLGLFGQDAIGKSRTREASNDLLVRFGSAGTVEDVVAYERGQEHMARQIEAWTKLAAGEQGEAELLELARPYEPLRGWPLANGLVLLAAGRDAWRSADGRKSSWVGDDLDVTFSAVALADPSTRLACATLPETLGFDGFAVGPGGDVLLIPRDRQVADLWVLTGSGCAFEQRDPIRRLAHGELGVPHASGLTAAVLAGHLSWAEAKQRSVRKLSLDGVELRDGALRWLGDRVVVVPARLDYALAAARRAERVGVSPSEAQLDGLPSGRDAVVFIELPAASETQVRAAVVPIDALVGPTEAEPSTIADVFPLPDKPGVVAVHVETPTRAPLLTLELRGDAAWHDALADDYDLPAATTFEPGALVVSRLADELGRGLDDLALAPDGGAAAWSAVVDGEREIMLLRLGDPTATPRRLTTNIRADMAPRFVGRDRLLIDSSYVAADDLPQVEAVRALGLPAR
jgi:hypothetical protein